MSGNENLRGINAPALIAYAFAAFLLAAAQTSSLTDIFPLGVKPPLVLALVCSAAYFFGSSTGAVAGIISGVLTDALGGTGVAMSALLYMLLGYFLGAYTADRRQSRSSGHIGGWSVALAATTGFGVIFTLVGLFINAGRPNLLLSLWYIALPEAIFTYVFGWTVGPIVMGFRRLAGGQNRKGENG